MLGKLFYVAIVLGLVFNLLGDVSVYQQNSVETETGNWVKKSYEVIQLIDEAKIKVLESQASKSPAPGLKASFMALGKALQDIPYQTQRVAHLEALNKGQLIAPKNNPALQIISEMSLAEQSLLEDRLKSDSLSNSRASAQILTTNIIDLSLLLIIIAFFVYERKMSTKMQGALTSALAHVESVNQSLLRSMSKKDSKFKMAVHDLKNPIGSIRGFAELLQDEMGHSLSTIEMVEIIKRISNNTLTLVESVLKTEEEEDDLNKKEVVKVTSVLKETCLFLEPIARGKRQTIQIEGDVEDFTYLASRQKIQDIFYNILSNALKYSPPSSVVLVSVGTEDQNYFIQIRDQGPGFTKDDFTKMFLPGARLSARPSGGESSSGIGLYSVKNAVESLRAEVDIRNNKDRGACVTVKFPRSTDPVIIPATSVATQFHTEILID